MEPRGGFQQYPPPPLFLLNLFLSKLLLSFWGEMCLWISSKCTSGFPLKRGLSCTNAPTGNAGADSVCASVAAGRRVFCGHSTVSSSLIITRPGLSLFTMLNMKMTGSQICLPATVIWFCLLSHRCLRFSAAADDSEMWFLNLCWWEMQHYVSASDETRQRKRWGSETAREGKRKKQSLETWRAQSTHALA